MPLAKLKPEFDALAAPAAPAISADLDRAAPTPSPARVLQQRLALSTAAAEPRWSPRASVAFVIATSLALWMAILAAAAEAVRAVA